MEDYLVRYLIERNEVDYDAHADLLYKLSAQLVARVRSYLETDAGSRTSCCTMAVSSAISCLRK